MALADEGYYKGRVRSWDLTKKNGKYVFTLYTGLTGFNPVDPNGEMTDLQRPLKKSVFYHISQNNKDMILAELRAVGYPADKPLDAKLLTPGLDTSVDFSAGEAVFELEHDTYPEKVNGNPTGKVKDTERIRICRRKVSAPLAMEDADQFNQLFGGEDTREPAPF